MRLLFTPLLFALSTLGAQGDCEPLPLGEQFRWFHAPKTGTSFAATLFHYLCPTSLPPDIGTVVRGGTVWPRVRRADGTEIGVPLRVCHETWPDDRPGPRPVPLDKVLTDGHTPLNYSQVERYDRPIVGLFRKPRERVISAFFDARHVDCQLDRRAAACCSSCPPQDADNLAKLQEDLDSKLESAHCLRSYGPQCPSVQLSLLPKYAHWPGLSGCYAKLLTGRACNADVSLQSSDVALAVSRLRRDFAFVGLTEFFDVSVCVFGAMFGGTFAPANMLQNFRPNRHSNRSELLTDYVDKDDEAVYSAAAQLFESQVRNFGGCARGDMCRAAIGDYLAARGRPTARRRRL